MSSKKPATKSKSKQRPVVQDRGSVEADMLQSLIDSTQQTAGFSQFTNMNAFSGMFSNIQNPNQPQTQQLPPQFSNPPQNPYFQNQLQPPQQYQHYRQPPQQSQSTPYYPRLRDEEDDEVEEVPETPRETVPEPEPETASDPKGKKVRCPKVPWSDEETKILAERYVYVSEHPDAGNDQNFNSFWGEVRKQYNSLVTEKRRADQISGKWAKIQRDVKIFIGIYSKLEGMWQSGAAGEDVMNAARKQFKAQTHRQFAFEDAWRVLRNCPKFIEGEGVAATNKRKQADDIPLNVQTEASSNPHTSSNPDPTQFENLLKDHDQIRRPPSRAKSQRDSYSSDAASRMSSDEVRLKIAQSTEVSQLAAN